MSFLRRTMRGFRIVEIGALTVVLALALAVYMVKARAGRETGDITTVENQIADEQRRIRLLQAEAAHLEQPERLERLSEAMGLGPTADKRETALDRLSDVAHAGVLTPPPDPTPAVPVQPGAPQ